MIPSISPEPAQGSPLDNKGYRKKPVWIYLVAIILIFNPIGNLFYSLLVDNPANLTRADVWLYWVTHLSKGTIALWSLLSLSGVALLYVSTWTWKMSMTAIVIVVAYNMAMFLEHAKTGWLSTLSSFLITIAFGWILFSSEFRRPYLFPKLQWWRSSQRKIINMPIKIGNTDDHAFLVNISLSGLLVEWPPDQAIPPIHGRVNIMLTPGVVLVCEMKRQTSRGYGFQFVNLNKEQIKTVKSFIKRIEKGA